MSNHPHNKRAAKGAKFYLSRACLYLLILLLLLIPTYAAVATYTAKKNAPVIDIHTVYESLALVGPTNYKQSASAKENAVLFSVFTTLCQDGDKMVTIPPRFLEGHYVATLSSTTTIDTYDFYFSPDETTCYYTNPAGEIFRSGHDLIPEFLSNTYAFELYGASTLPVLTTAATDEVVPTSVSRSYRTTNGTFVERTQTDTTTDLLTYPIANDVAFYFSVQPSSHELLIHRNGELLYSGSTQGISLPLQNEEILDFEIRATFSPSSEQDYYGEIVYRFKMQVVEAAHFTPNKTQLHAGDVLFLRCENVKNAAKLVVSATPTLESPAIIFSRGEYVYAAIPFPQAGNKRLQITYGTVTDAFDITVYTHPGTVHAVSADTLRGNWSALLTETLPTLIAQKGAENDSGLTPRTITALPHGKLFGYGDTIHLDDAQISASPLPFDLYLTSGPVRALAAGRVHFVGSDPILGNYVIIDHGCGLYTWYAGLSAAHVVAGTVVAVGDSIGLPSTILYADSSVLIMATLGKAAVSLEQLCNASAVNFN